MHKKRIVLVEDNPGDVILVRESLSFAGIENDLVCFADLPQALAAIPQLEGATPDAVLLDLSLTRGDGLTFLEEMRASPTLHHVPVIILTSSASTADREAATRAGANAFVPKPTQLDEFLDQVSSAVKAVFKQPAAGASC
jgi:CheY-like chemotaxis protein